MKISLSQTIFATSVVPLAWYRCQLSPSGQLKCDCGKLCASCAVARARRHASHIPRIYLTRMGQFVSIGWGIETKGGSNPVQANLRRLGDIMSTRDETECGRFHRSGEDSARCGKSGETGTIAVHGRSADCRLLAEIPEHVRPERLHGEVSRLEQDSLQHHGREGTGPPRLARQDGPEDVRHDARRPQCRSPRHGCRRRSPAAGSRCSS